MAAQADDGGSIGYKPACHSSSAIDSTGRVVECEYKVFIYDDGSVYWELRRPFLVALNAARKVVEVAKLSNSINGSIAILLEYWRATMDVAIKPSLKVFCVWIYSGKVQLLVKHTSGNLD